jgi:lysophospholipase L1-like esterase
VDLAFLGDSLTEGWPGAAYFPLLEEALPQHRLRNYGRAGDTVADLLRRMRRTGLTPVAAAVIWVGANDAVIGDWDASDFRSESGWPDRLSRIRDAYDELVEWTQARPPRLLLVRPRSLAAAGSPWAARAADLGRMVDDHGAVHRAEVVDLAPAFALASAAGQGPFTIDGVHFTDAGAFVVAAAFAAAIGSAD